MDVRLKEVASADPTIKNISHFMEFSERFSESFEDETEAVQFTALGRSPSPFSDRDDRGLDNLKFSTGTSSDVRKNVSTRPAQLERKRSQLKNRPTRSQRGPLGDEVFFSDRIPLFTYRRIANDTAVAMATDLLVGLITSLKYSIKLSDPKKTDVVKAIYDRHHSALVSEMVRKGRQNGFCFGQKIWSRRTLELFERKDGKEKSKFRGSIIDLDRVKMINPESNLHFYLDKYEDLAYIEQHQAEKGRVKVTRQQLFWFVHQPEYSNIFGTSAFKKIYPFWHYYKIGFQYAIRHLEKVGSPHLEGRFPQGSTKVGKGKSQRRVPNKEVILMMAEAVKSTGGVAMPSDRYEDGSFMWSLEYKYPDKNSAANYIEFLSYLDGKKMQGIGVPGAIVSQDSGSNYSDTDARVQILMIIVESLISMIEGTIKREILDYIVMYNFGNKYVDDLIFRMDRGALGRRKLLKELLLQYLKIAENQEGFVLNSFIDFDALLEDFGAPAAARDEVMSRDPFAEKKEDLVKKQERQDDQNDKQGARQGAPKRESERRPAKKNVGDE
tara:strand:+ start:5159 stop:6817 length:1659 start_codon:yes stop_codon:yes gene_type:complete